MPSSACRPDPFQGCIRTLALAAAIGSGTAQAWTAIRPGLDGDSYPPARLKALVYRNPERPHNQPVFDSLDDFIRLVRANMETDRLMRDSLGVSGANIAIYIDYDATLDSLRNRVLGLLQSLELRYQADGIRRMRLGEADAYQFNIGYIPVPSAYFALRDSLLRFRSPSVKVDIDEAPYHKPFPYDGDSTLAFLERLRERTIGEAAEFRARLVEHIRRGGLDFLYPRGVQCDITIGRLLASAEINDQSAEDGQTGPVRLSRFRDRPLLQRLSSLENRVRVALALSGAALLMGLSLGIGFAAGRMRRRRRG